MATKKDPSRSSRKLSGVIHGRRLTDAEAVEFWENAGGKQTGHTRRKGYTPSHPDSDDAVQEAILKALTHPDKVREARCPKGLARCMKRRAYIDLQKRYRKRAMPSEAAGRSDLYILARLAGESPCTSSPQDEEERNALRALVLEKMWESLPREMGTAMCWHGSKESRTREETATALGVSNRTVDKHLSTLRIHANKEFPDERRQLFGPHKTRRYSRTRRSSRS